MLPFHNILQMIASGIIAIYQDYIFWIVTALIAYQYWRIVKNQTRMLGVKVHSLGRQVILSVLFGSIGGILASFLLTVTGINLNQLGLEYIWPVALILLLIDMRFLCFAYAGGLVALSQLLFGWPEINAVQILVLVGILHITESFLILVSGYYSSMPIILKHNNRLVGAFSLQNFWPLPLVLMVAVMIKTANMPSELLNMPSWWPLLPLGLEASEEYNWVYVMIPVIAALGYADIAVSSHPKARRRKSALHLGIYSIVLLLLSFLSLYFSWLKILAALFAPLGHEFLIQMDNRRELAGKPLFVPSSQGIMVLDTIDNTPAAQLKIKPGDIILRLNGMSINNRLELAQALGFITKEIAIEVLRQGIVREYKTYFSQGDRQLGIITVPEGDEIYYMELPNKGNLLGKLLKYLKR